MVVEVGEVSTGISRRERSLPGGDEQTSSTGSHFESEDVSSSHLQLAHLIHCKSRQITIEYHCKEMARIVCVGSNRPQQARGYAPSLLLFHFCKQTEQANRPRGPRSAVARRRPRRGQFASRTYIVRTYTPPLLCLLLITSSSYMHSKRPAAAAHTKVATVPHDRYMLLCTHYISEHQP